MPPTACSIAFRCGLGLSGLFSEVVCVWGWGWFAFRVVFGLFHSMQLGKWCGFVQRFKLHAVV